MFHTTSTYNAEIMGIHSGGATDGSYSIFSTISEIYADYTLDSSPVGVRLTGNLKDQAYTFCIYMN